MSDTETGANEPHTEDAPTDSEEPDPEPVNWEAAQAGFAKRQQQRRELEVAMPEQNGVAVFVVRGLRQEERDDVESAAVPANQKRRQRRNGGGGDVDLSNLDMSAVREKILEYGLEEGPPGFNPAREDHRAQIPPGVKDELVDEIEDLSSLDVAERETFQAGG